MDEAKRIAVIMSGGGARAAYQVGVLKAIARILPPGIANPFPIICGASAGAINAASLAVYADNFQGAVRRMERVWANFHVNHVFRSDFSGMVANWARWWGSLLSGSVGGGQVPLAMFDRAPLHDLLERYLDCSRIQGAIDAGILRALSITASGYGSGQSVSFYQGSPDIRPWKRAVRLGVASAISVDHLMASSAIPLVFEAVKINREFFGDGSMRQTAPISPALHLGASRILVIGVRQERHQGAARDPDHAEYPTLAQIGGHVLSSIFLDALEADLERLKRINETVRLIPEAERASSQNETLNLRTVESLLIAPSRNISEIATRHRHSFPRGVRYLLKSLGAWKRSGGDLLSYILFEKPFTQELIELGFSDAMLRETEIREFFRSSP